MRDESDPSRMTRSSKRLLRNWTSRTILSVLCLAASAVAVRAATEEVEDADISRAIESEFWINNTVDGNKIDVNTLDGVVTLSGSVDSILARERAEEIAETIVGVHAIVNLIEVAGISRGDSELAKAVENALLYDPATDSYEVQVAASRGTVTLTGTVDSWTEKQLCETVAKGVRGVRAVKNDISIRYPSDRPDAEIQAEIKARLANDVRHPTRSSRSGFAERSERTSMSSAGRSTWTRSRAGSISRERWTTPSR